MERQILEKVLQDITELKEGLNFLINYMVERNLDETLDRLVDLAIQNLTNDESESSIFENDINVNSIK